MKKLLGILVLCLLLGALASCDDGKIDCRFYGNCTSMEKLKNSITDLNPIDYFEKRKNAKMVPTDRILLLKVKDIIKIAWNFRNK